VDRCVALEEEMIGDMYREAYRHLMMVLFLGLVVAFAVGFGGKYAFDRYILPSKLAEIDAQSQSREAVLSYSTPFSYTGALNVITPKQAIVPLAVYGKSHEVARLNADGTCQYVSQPDSGHAPGVVQHFSRDSPLCDVLSVIAEAHAPLLRIWSHAEAD
jgi:hypothetical protein